MIPKTILHRAAFKGFLESGRAPGAAAGVPMLL
jgi:hypothetical protein